MSQAEKRRKKRQKRQTEAKPKSYSTATHSWKDKHIAAIQMEKRALEAMTSPAIKRIRASFPEIAKTLDYLYWLTDMVDPTTGQSWNPRVSVSTPRGGGMEGAAARVAHFKRIQDDVRLDLRSLNRRLSDAIDGKDYDRWKPEAPRCRKKDPRTGEKCELYGRRQSWDQVVCAACGRPFVE